MPVISLAQPKKPQFNNDVLAVIGTFSSPKEALALYSTHHAHASIFKSKQHKKYIDKLMARSFLTPQEEELVNKNQLELLVHVSTLTYEKYLRKSSYIAKILSLTLSFITREELIALGEILSLHSFIGHLVTQYLTATYYIENKIEPLTNSFFTYIAKEEFSAYYAKRNEVKRLLKKANFSNDEFRAALKQLFIDGHKWISKKYFSTDEINIRIQDGVARLSPEDLQEVIRALGSASSPSVAFEALDCAIKKIIQNDSELSLFFINIKKEVCQNTQSLRNEEPFRNLENALGEALANVLAENIKLAFEALKMPLFKKILPQYQQRTRPKANFFKRIWNGFFWGIAGLLLGLRFLTETCIAVPVLTAFRIASLPLKGTYDLLFDTENVGANFVSGVELTASGIGSLLTLPLSIFYLFLVPLKFSIGGFYFASLVKDYKEILLSLKSSSYRFKTVADAAQEYEIALQKSTTSAISEKLADEVTANRKPVGSAAIQVPQTDTNKPHQPVEIAVNTESASVIQVREEPSEERRNNSSM